MYVNEMQRTINGLGGGKTGGLIPYGHWQPYRPGAIAQDMFGQTTAPADTSPMPAVPVPVMARLDKLEQDIKSLKRASTITTIALVMIGVGGVASFISVVRGRR